MSHYKAKTNFSLNGVLYEEGDDVEVKTKMQLITLMYKQTQGKNDRVNRIKQRTQTLFQP